MALTRALMSAADKQLLGVLARLTGSHVAPRARVDELAHSPDRRLAADWLFACYLCLGGLLCIGWVLLAQSPRQLYQWVAVAPLCMGGFALGRAATLAFVVGNRRCGESLNARPNLQSSVALLVAFACLVAGSLVAAA